MSMKSSPPRPSSKGRGPQPPASSTQTWIIVAVAACALLGGIVVLRQALRSPEPEVAPVAPAHLPSRSPGAPRSSFRTHEPLADDSFGDEVAAPAPGVKGAPAKRAAKAGQPNEPAADTTPGEQPADDASTTPAARARALKDGIALSFDSAAKTGDQTPPLVSQGIDVDKATGAARFPPEAVLAYPDSGGIDMTGGSIMFWVQLQWDLTQDIEGKALAEMGTGTWENRFTIRMGPRFVGFLLTTSDGWEQSIGTAVEWKKGDWHHVACTWGDQLMQLYVDSVLKDARSYEGSVLIPPETPLYIGSSKKGSERQGTVLMANWYVFKQVLSADDIATFMEQTTPPS
jgi:hypothetical protein